MNSRIALITGAAQGIGLACAHALAAHDFKAIAVDIQDGVIQEAADAVGKGAVGLTCDISSPESVTALLDQVEADKRPYGRIIREKLAGEVPNPRICVSKATEKELQTLLTDASD